VDDFIEQYEAGRTPNPCVRCNQYIKFNELWKKLKPMGVDFFATGHYARSTKHQPSLRLRLASKIQNSNKIKNSKFKLLKAKDAEKDQTYFLHQVLQNELKHTLFPIGDLTKSEVRALAKKFGLATAEKKESQEICFVADGQVGEFLKRYIKFEKGAIKDVETEEILGEHQGLPFYTIGQRKGIGLSGGPWYVARLDKKNNVLWVSKNEKDFLQDNLIVKNVNWISGVEPAFPLKVNCRIRYRAKDESAVVTKLADNKYSVKFDQAQRAVTPGQYCVFWQGEECLGGGEIV
ncbi:MAG: tRNA 2-thiouridine(34) synthase MnmA, partial [Patescibacteria group bacterium]